MFHFDPAALKEIAESHAESYRTARPFPHVVIDDLLPDDVVDALIEEFPDPNRQVWRAYDDPYERKLEGTDTTTMGDVTRAVFAEFNSAPFVNFLEQLTGIEGVITDPHLYGGGLHQIEPGGFLKVHADFNWYDRLKLDRRLNLLLYLNRDWDEAWGGHLELWDAAMTRSEARILPVANRCVIFSTTSDANHGHPDPLRCPADRTRRSMALYYYSNGRPAAELAREHGTNFAPRPGEGWRRPTTAVEVRLKRWIPPALWDLLRGIKRARTRDRG